MELQPELTASRRRARKGSNRLVKLVRRMHLHTGLLLLPWVMLFGLSGLLFNHANWFSPVEVVASLDAGEVENAGHFQKPHPGAIATEVIARLNAANLAPRLRLAPGEAAVIEGAFGFEGVSMEGDRIQIRISPNHGSAKITRYPRSSLSESPSFHGVRLPLDSSMADGWRRLADDLAREAGVELADPLIAAERGGVEVRFRVESAEDGRRWNVVYQLADGMVNARPADLPHGMDFNTLVGRLHKTHHYPDRIGARWAWTAVADATGIMMVFWGLSGLVMWWQLKPTRLAGMVGLSVAVVTALVIFSGTLDDLTFGPARQRGAGEGRPPRPAPDSFNQAPSAPRSSTFNP